MRSIPFVPVVPGRPVAAPKGRGMAWSLPHRFHSVQREAHGDGSGVLDPQVAEEAPPPATRVIEERVKTVQAGKGPPDIGFDLSINPQHECI